MPSTILLAGAGPSRRAQQVVRSRLSVGSYLRRLNAAQGTGLLPFGLPLARCLTPWYTFNNWCHRHHTVHQLRS